MGTCSGHLGGALYFVAQIDMLEKVIVEVSGGVKRRYHAALEELIVSLDNFDTPKPDIMKNVYRVLATRDEAMSSRDHGEERRMDGEAGPFTLQELDGF